MEFGVDDLGLATSGPPPVVGEQSYGEAQVLQPESSGSAIHQYTTYLVQAKLGEESYSSRKRYSDFEWLRAAMAACFPGVRIPPLPKKHGAAQGLLTKTSLTVEDPAFIETRRAGLDDFLKHCLKRKQLCLDSQILKRFLATESEEAVDLLKKRIDCVSFVSKSQKYSQIFADLKEAADIPTDDRITPCKEFVTAQMAQLRELADGFKQVVDAQEAVTRALSGAQIKLAGISHTEAGTLVSAGVPREARVELVEGLRQQSKVMQASPAMHYDLLLASTERELLEAEAMQEALDSVDLLEQDLGEAKEKAESMGTTLQRVLDGGEIPSTGTGVARMLGMAPKKDREERIVEMKAEYEQKQKEVVAIEEFHCLARKVLIHLEMGRFFNEKVVGNREAKDAFAARSRQTAERFGSIWGGAGVPSASHGYPGATTEADDALLEYE